MKFFVGEMQKSSDSAPIFAPSVPNGHELQLGLPMLVEYVFSGHSEHVALAWIEYAPGAQSVTLVS